MPESIREVIRPTHSVVDRRSLSVRRSISCARVRPRALIPGLDGARRLVHGGGRSAHATNRPTDAVGKSVRAGNLMTASASRRDLQSTQSGQPKGLVGRSRAVTQRLSGAPPPEQGEEEHIAAHPMKSLPDWI